MIQALVVDDEPLARARLKRLLESHSDFISVTGEADDGSEALTKIAKGSFDVVFLDIEMQDVSGIDVAKSLAKMDVPPAIIFTTAYSEYAITAVNLQAVGYLLKPIETADLADILGKLAKVNRIQASHRATKDADISYQLGNKLLRINTKEVCYFHADGKYTGLVTIHGSEGLVDESLKDLESRLGSAFIRIHRHSLVNCDEISALEQSIHGHFVRLKNSDVVLPVSRRALKLVKSLL